MITEVSLKRVLKKAGSALEALIQSLNEPVQVWDRANNLLIGQPHGNHLRSHPITAGNQILGRVVGGEEAIAVAKLLGYLGERELEVKALAHDALDKYREINLLYNLSEKLNASLETSIVVKTVLEEVRRLIPATGASIALLHPTTADFRVELTFTDGGYSLPEDILRANQGITGAVVQAGQGEIVNHTAIDPRYQPGLEPVASLICGPLKIEHRVIGVLNISSLEPIEYTAQHLKLLTTIASQAAQAIENAQLYQQQFAAAQEREKQLQQQLQELQLEVDEAKRSHQVAEITETEYFQQLQQRAGQLRRRRV